MQAIFIKLKLIQFQHLKTSFKIQFKNHQNYTNKSKVQFHWQFNTTYFKNFIKSFRQQYNLAPQI